MCMPLKKTKLSSFLIVYFPSLFSTLLFSPFSFSTTNILNKQRSLEALSMGDAYTSFVKNSDAFFYNPASLTKFKKLKLNIVEGHIGTNLLLISRIKDVLKLKEKEHFQNTIGSLYGKSLLAKAGFRTSIEFPYFIAMITNDTHVHISPTNPVYPSVPTYLYNDFTSGAGLALPLTSLIDVGIIAKYIARQSLQEEVSADWLLSLDVDVIRKELLKRGRGLFFDIGVNITPDILIKPVFSFVWKNVTKSKFKSFPDSPNEVPLPPRTNLNASFSFLLKNDFLSYTPIFEMKHILRPDISWTRKVHLGLQIQSPFLRVGLGFNQGYFSTGAGLKMFGNMIDIYGAFYQTELGQYPGQIVERRVALNVKLALETDLGISEKEGQRGTLNIFDVTQEFWKKLKKRR